MVYWITGRRHSGKTTLAKRMAARVQKAVVLDGDEFREEFPEDFTAEGRQRNQERLASVARILERQGFVPIIACVSPKRGVRSRLQATFAECIEIQLPFGDLWPNTTYEE